MRRVVQKASTIIRTELFTVLGQLSLSSMDPFFEPRGHLGPSYGLSDWTTKKNIGETERPPSSRSKDLARSVLGAVRLGTAVQQCRESTSGRSKQSEFWTIGRRKSTRSCIDNREMRRRMRHCSLRCEGDVTSREVSFFPPPRIMAQQETQMRSGKFLHLQVLRLDNRQILHQGPYESDPNGRGR